MANWWHTSFSTDNKDILNLIQDACVDYHYYEDKGWGHCELRYGMATLDMEAIAKVAEEQGLSFRITSEEPINCISHIWEFEDGKEVCLERIQGEREDVEYEIISNIDYEEMITDCDETTYYPVERDDGTTVFVNYKGEEMDCESWLDSL